MNRMLTAIWMILFLSLTLLPNPAVAWGPEGHAIVAEIADHYLTPRAKKQVRRILKKKKMSDFDVAVWADIIRGDKEYEALYPGNGHWHYVDWDVFKHYDKSFKLTLPDDGQDVVDQILRWQEELAQSKVPPARRLDALRFLIHFVGDLHQPLHCAYRYGDMGGNMIPVNSFQGRNYSFDSDTPMDYAPSLHGMWDVYLVKELLGDQWPKTVARRMWEQLTPEQVEYWSGGEPYDWAVGSYWKARKQAYHWTNGKNMPFKWTRPGMDITSKNYIDSHLPVVEEQLEKAGLRLAYLLNMALDPRFARAHAEK